MDMPTPTIRPQHPALQRMADHIRAAGQQGHCLAIEGGNTKHFYGAPPPSGRQGVAPERLSTHELPRVLDHEPTELVVTASGGLLLSELQDQLASAHQYLPFDPPHFGAAATVGGMVAAGLSGPARATSGAVRDYVLGVHMLSGMGELLQFGGQVMKNVAGYDVSRLLAGSLGQLGVVVQVSLKVLPLPAAMTTLVFDWSQAAALSRLNQWAGLPLPLNASCWEPGPEQPRLWLRLQGAKAAVASAVQRMVPLGGREVPADQARQQWDSLREQNHPFFHLAPDQCLWRLSIPDTTPPLDLSDAGIPDTLIEWGGALRWVKAPASAAPLIRAAVTRAGGQATLFRPSQASPIADMQMGIFTPLTATMARLHHQVLAQLDPHGVFNTGRLGLDTPGSGSA